MFAPLSVAPSASASGLSSTGAISSAGISLILAIFSNNAAISNSKRDPKKNSVSKWATTQQQKLSKLPLLKKTPPPPPKRSNLLVQLYQTWFRLPQIFRFFVGGNIGNLGFFYTEQFLFDWLSTNPRNFFSLEFLDQYLAAVSFFSAYILQIVTTHLLFAVLVYGLSTIDTLEKYGKTLWAQFRVYFVALIGSTVLNTYLINRGVDKTVAFFGTMAVFSCINYVLISASVQQAVESSVHHNNDKEQQGKNSSSHGNTKKMRTTATKTPNQQKKKKASPPSSPPLGGWIVNKIQRGGTLFGVVANHAVNNTNAIQQQQGRDDKQERSLLHSNEPSIQGFGVATGGGMEQSTTTAFATSGLFMQ